MYLAGPHFCLKICDIRGFAVSLQYIGVLRNGGLLFRMTLLAVGGAGVLYVRWKIMGTGPPPFTEVDNPASFADSVVVRVSSECVHPVPRSFAPPPPLTPSTPTKSLINGTPPCLFAVTKDIPG